MSLTKQDLQNISLIVSEGFSKEFPKAFAQEFPKAFAQEFPKAFAQEFPKHFKKAFEDEYPRLKKEIYATFVDGINCYILPQFEEIRKWQEETDEWKEDTDEFLKGFFTEVKKGFNGLKKRADDNVIDTEEKFCEHLKIIGKYEKNLVKKKHFKELKVRVETLEGKEPDPDLALD